MSAFRALLILVWIVFVSYTAVVITNHGMGLLSIFFGDISAMGWPGQFNLDFLFMLMFSALWVAWRNEFSASRLMLSLCAFLGGTLFVPAYLFILTWNANGNMKAVVIGRNRAGA